MKFELPEISPEHRQTIAHADEAYADVARLNEAIAKQGHKVAASKATHETAAAALAESDTALALATTDAESRRIEAEGKKLSAALAEAQSDVDRQVRVAAALTARLAAAETTLEEERITLQKVVKDHGSVVIQACAEQVALTAGPLIDAMRALVVASSAAGAHVTAQLTDMMLPDLRGNGYLLHGLSMRAYVDGQQVKLGEIGDDDAALLELAQRAREPRAMLEKLKAYTPRTARPQEQPHGATLRQVAL
jgi:hypothetical protein